MRWLVYGLRTLGALAAVVLLAAPEKAGAAEIHVPGDYDTIQDAISAASDGDVVLVGSGNYGETIDLLGKAITVRSTEGALHTTAVTRFEMLSGARTKRQRAAVSKLLAAVPALPVDEAAADAAAEVRRALDSRGEGIGMADSLIAGTVIRHGGTLLTCNRRHFDRVEGLPLAKLDS